jgi:hypothetical protein
MAKWPVRKVASYDPPVEPVIYAADIGSITAGNFGWARLDPEQGSTQVERNDGTEIAELVANIGLRARTVSRVLWAGGDGEPWRQRRIDR